MNHRVFVAAWAALAGCAAPISPPAPAAPGDPGAANSTADPPPRPARPVPAIAPWGFDLAGMDRAIDPGDSFYRHANGRWLASTQIPPDQAMVAMFLEAHERNQVRVREIVEAAHGAPGSDDQRIGDYYRTFLDQEAIEARGFGPIRPRLDAIAKIRNVNGVVLALASSARRGAITPLWISIRQDDRAPDTYLPNLGQGGLGLPDRSMYDVHATQFEARREGYRRYIARMFTLVGMAGAERRAAAVYALEDKLANTHWSRVENRDPQRTYHKMTIRALEELAPAIDWKSWLRAVGLEGQPAINVNQPSAIAAACRLLRDQPLAVWRDYLTLHELTAAAPYLPRAFVDAHFEMFSRTLWGVAQDRPRWQHGVAEVSDALGDAVGKRYVALHFPAAARARAEALVHDVVAAMGPRIEALTWMGPATKAKALAKLAAYRIKIGYPRTWRDDSALTIIAGDALGNADRVAEHAYRRRLARLGGPVDRDAWNVPAMTADAFYSASRNEMVFPAGLFQPPFFDPDADPAVNYGAIGETIGHEVSHGFDDQGAQFDGTGALTNWWTDEDAARFKAATRKLVAQYNAYCPIPARDGTPAQCVNGELTLGENIADLGGLAVAYDAYHRSLNGQPAPVLDGMTGDQRFFLGLAQTYRCVYREAALANALANDPHSPAELRVSTVRNLDAWYAAFHPGETSALYLPPDQRVRIW